MNVVKAIAIAVGRYVLVQSPYNKSARITLITQKMIAIAVKPMTTFWYPPRRLGAVRNRKSIELIHKV